MDEAVRLLDEAEFERAREVLGALEASDEGLTREEVIRLYATRAAAHLALEDDVAMRADLARVVALEPEYSFGPSARPELQEGLRALGPQPVLALIVEVDGEGEARVLRARATGDPDHVARAVRLYVRAAPDGPWREIDGGEAPVGAGAMDYRAELVGSGGATLASRGSEATPLRVDALAAAPAGGGDDTIAIALGITGGVVAAVVLTIVIAVVASPQTSTVTAPGVPTIFALSF